jgi:chemotaxis protein CheD
MLTSEQINEFRAKTFITTGCFATGSKEGLFTSSPLGSCVAIVAYDINRQIGGLAHAMLPGKSVKGNDNKYAENIITNLIDKLTDLGAMKTNIEICLVGGANVLKRKNDIIGNNLIISIFEILKTKKLPVKAKSLGGFERRSVSLDLCSGLVNYTIGESNNKTLYQFSAIEMKGD